MSIDEEDARRLGQRCANAVLDRGAADPQAELDTVLGIIGSPIVARMSECTYQTLFGYFETLLDYVYERTDL